MEHRINNEVKSIEISGIRKFFNLVNDYDNMVSLTIGQPDFPTPEHIKKMTIEAIHRNHTTYTIMREYYLSELQYLTMLKKDINLIITQKRRF